VRVYYIYADTSKAKLTAYRRLVVKQDVDKRACSIQIGSYSRYKGVVFSNNCVAKGLVVALKYYFS
jgi:hypothetical protein